MKPVDTLAALGLAGGSAAIGAANTDFPPRMALLAVLLGLLIFPTRAVIKPFSLKDVQLGVDTVQARASGRSTAPDTSSFTY